MSGWFVDLTYRGLALAHRTRLVDRPGGGDARSAGFLELAAPMPVGTILTLATDEGVSFEVTVTEVVEQATPGMVVTPVRSPASEAWWGGRVGSIEVAPPVDVVHPKRRDDEAAKLVDDGKKTAVMEVAIPISEDADTEAAGPQDPARKPRRKRRRR